jgi:hypothetical protein
MRFALRRRRTTTAAISNKPAARLFSPSPDSDVGTVRAGIPADRDSIVPGRPGAESAAVTVGRAATARVPGATMATVAGATKAGPATDAGPAIATVDTTGVVSAAATGGVGSDAMTPVAAAEIQRARKVLRMNNREGRAVFDSASETNGKKRATRGL